MNLKKWVPVFMLLTLFGSVVAWQPAEAAYYRRCQVVNIGGLRFRTCQGHYGPGPRWRWRHWRRWHRWQAWRRWRRWHRWHSYRRCTVRFTPWGRVRRCVVY